MNLRVIRHLIVVALVAVSFNSSATVTLEKYKDTSEVTIKIHHQIIEEDLGKVCISQPRSPLAR